MVKPTPTGQLLSLIITLQSHNNHVHRACRVINMQTRVLCLASPPINSYYPFAGSLWRSNAASGKTAESVLTHSLTRRFSLECRHRISFSAHSHTASSSSLLSQLPQPSSSSPPPTASSAPFLPQQCLAIRYVLPPFPHRTVKLGFRFSRRNHRQ